MLTIVNVGHSWFVCFLKNILICHSTKRAHRQHVIFIEYNFFGKRDGHTPSNSHQLLIMAEISFPKKLCQVLEKELLLLPETTVHIILEYVLVPPVEIYTVLYPEQYMSSYTCDTCKKVMFQPNTKDMPICPCGSKWMSGRRCKKDVLDTHIDSCTACFGQDQKSRSGCKQCIQVDFCDFAKKDDDVCLFLRCLLCETYVCAHNSSSKGGNTVVCTPCKNYALQGRNIFRVMREERPPTYEAFLDLFQKTIK